VDADRVEGAEDGDRAGQPDPFSAGRDRGEHDRGGGDREVEAVVLAEREHVQPQLLTEDRVVDGVGDTLRRVDLLPGVEAGLQVAERQDAEFHGAPSVADRGRCPRVGVIGQLTAQESVADLAGAAEHGDPHACHQL
jgi:hypothetical protein